MPSRLRFFYGLLQIPLEDFTSPALKRERQKRVDGAESTTAAFDISREWFASIRRTRTGGNAVFIFFPRTAELAEAIDKWRSDNKSGRVPWSRSEHLSIVSFPLALFLLLPFRRAILTIQFNL